MTLPKPAIQNTLSPLGPPTSSRRFRFELSKTLDELAGFVRQVGAAQLSAALQALVVESPQLYMNPGGRLSVVSTNPAPNGTNSGTTLYLVGAVHNMVSLWDGEWILRDFSHHIPSISLSPGALTRYDIFAHWQGGVERVQLDAEAWTSPSARAIGLQFVDGVPCHGRNKRRRYLGNVIVDASNNFHDSVGTRWVVNYYNKCRWVDLCEEELIESDGTFVDPLGCCVSVDDGTVTGDFDTLVFPAGTLTDNEDGTVTYTPPAGASNTVTVNDGTVNDDFDTINFPAGTLTDNMDGSVTYTPAAGTIDLDDGTTSGSFNTINFPAGTLVDEGGGVATYDPSGLFGTGELFTGQYGGQLTASGWEEELTTTTGNTRTDSSNTIPTGASQVKCSGYVTSDIDFTGNGFVKMNRGTGSSGEYGQVPSSLASPAYADPVAAGTDSSPESFDNTTHNTVRTSTQVMNVSPGGSLFQTTPPNAGKIRIFASWIINVAPTS